MPTTTTRRPAGRPALRLPQTRDEVLAAATVVLAAVALALVAVACVLARPLPTSLADYPRDGAPVVVDR